ncbi:MAG: ABC transporter permease [Deltaproteobacteria bacterium]|nr:ABC transporter permease [Deltaproteobacteria bacterium]
MITYIVRRLILSVVVMFIVTVLVFLLIHLIPGDPARCLLGEEATLEQIEELRKELWLDRPLTVQYGHWLTNVFKGDLGKSVLYGQPVKELIMTRLPVTLNLSIFSFIISTVLGIGFGIICAIRRGKTIDTVIALFSNIGIATPIFWLAVIMIYTLGLKLGWLPLQGYTSPLEDPIMNIRQAIMPVFCMVLFPMAVITRQTRSSMLEVVRQDYIRTAWSKGLKERVIVISHAMKNALIPVVTLLGMQFRVLVGGLVLIETVFNIPGMGRLMVTSVFNKDSIAVQGCTLVIAIVVLLVNLAVDISYGWLDPRIRYE